MADIIYDNNIMLIIWIAFPLRRKTTAPDDNSGFFANYVYNGHGCGNITYHDGMVILRERIALVAWLIGLRAAGERPPTGCVNF